ncbi:MAG: DNA-3-methyladenine glycosylase 2 family protein [Candidatus Curtissbacteria bacterium]|nr:DNA-3-methyladenine glycosylase 2 family protein [Candidatus Curtissbacteria bacterium]
MDKYLKHIKKADPILFRASKGLELWPLTKSENYFWDLVRKIIGQQLSVKSAAAIASRFQELYGADFSPEAVIETRDEKLRKVGLSGTKVSYIKGLALAVNDKELILAGIDKLSNEEIIEELTKIKGIGPWSAEMFLMFSLARPDVFSLGDLGLRRAMERLYEIEDLKLAQMEEMSLVWSPYRTYASMTLWKTLANEPQIRLS